MSTYSQARKDIRFLASSLRGLVALDAQLGEAGGLEKQIAALTAERNSQVTQVEAAKAAVEEAKVGVDQIIADGKVKLASIEAEGLTKLTIANDRAAEVDRLIADAQRQAAALVEQGTADAAQARLDAAGKLGELRKAISAAQAQLSTTQEAVTAAEAKKVVAEAALDGLRKKLG